MPKIIELTNKYIILATPLILFSLLSNVYLVYSLSGTRLINMILALILLFLMTGMFLSGWFSMIKHAIIEPEREETNSLMKEFVPGVGEYFLPVVGALGIILVFTSIIMMASYFLGMTFIGDPGISVNELSKAMQDVDSLRSFVTNLSNEQMIKINFWNILLMISMGLNYFVLFLYMPALFFKNRNPLLSFFVSLKDLFSKKFFKTLGVFLLIFLMNFIISIFSTIFGGNVIMHFLLTLLYFYYIVAIGVGVFYYYNKNFVESHIGQNVDVKI